MTRSMHGEIVVSIQDLADFRPAPIPAGAILQFDDLALIGADPGDLDKAAAVAHAMGATDLADLLRDRAEASRK